jgi:hypothetical protein
MASEKQIAANRANARKSTGPRSSAGKKRASLNTLRHGLTSKQVRVAHAEMAERLAREYSGGSTDRICVDLARCAAGVDLELRRIRQIWDQKFASLASLGAANDEHDFRRWRNELRRSIMQNQVKFFLKMRFWEILRPFPEAMSETPAAIGVETARMKQTVQDLLVELKKISRYEQRAAARLDSVILQLGIHRKQNRRASSLRPGSTDS